MIKTSEWIVVEESDLSDLVVSEYGVPWRYQQLNELSNDSVHYIDVEDYWFDPDSVTIAEWQAKWHDHKDEFFAETACERGNQPFGFPPNGRIFADLLERGLIPKAFSLHVWW